MNELRLRMKNTSDDCFKNPDGSAILSNPSFDNSKSKYVSPCVNKPIFKRKLIEKYSTARYNINTKRVLVRNSSANRTSCNDKISVVLPKNASSSIDKDKKRNTSRVRATGSSNEAVTAASSPIQFTSDEGSLKSSKSNIKSDHVTTSGTTIADKTPSKKDPSSSPVPCEPPIISDKPQNSRVTRKRKFEPPIISGKPQDSRVTKKRKFASAPESSSNSQTTWKIAPKRVYNQLWDLYQSTTEIKTEEEPIKEPKKRKYHWTKKRTPKKPISLQKKVADGTHFDPYIECLKEADTQSPDSTAVQNEDKFGFVMYLGVDRPLFPLVYRNLRTLNNSNDATITDFWAEFSLSTLVVKKADKKLKPILVPVKDPELRAIVSECIEEIVKSDKSNVSSTVFSSHDYMVKNSIIPQVCVKQEENDHVPEKKSRYKLRSLDTKPETSKSYESLADSYEKLTEKKSKRISNVKPIISTPRRELTETESEKISIKPGARNRKSIEKESEKISDIKPATSRGRKSTEKKSEEISDIKPVTSRGRKSTGKKTEEISDIKPATSRGRKSTEKKSEEISDIKPATSRGRKSTEKKSEEISDIKPVTSRGRKSTGKKTEEISNIKPVTSRRRKFVEKELEEISDIKPTIPRSPKSAEKEPEEIFDIKPTISCSSISAEKEPEEISDIKPATSLSCKFAEKEPEEISDIKPTTSRRRKFAKKKSQKISNIKPTPSRSRKSIEKEPEKVSEIETTTSRSQKFAEKESEKIPEVEPTTPTRSQAPALKSSPTPVPIHHALTPISPLTPAPTTPVPATVPSPISALNFSPNSIKSPTSTPTLVPATIPSPIPAPTSPTSARSPTPTPIPAIVPAPISALTSPPPIISPTPTPTAATEPTPTQTLSPTSAPATTSPISEPKPKNRAIRSKKPVLEEKKILKKFGYKECQVTVPKLSDTLIKYLSAGNYSNESAELSDPTERELIEETDDFGLIQCTRTDGIIIDYNKRNRSLVYFYKLKKMLDFQKTNNKYFICCDYMLIDRLAEGDEEVDIISIQKEDDDRDEFNRLASTKSSGPRNSRNPNDLFKMSKISEWKNKSNKISWVKNHDLKYVSDVKWLLISLDKHVASLTHANECVLRFRLLFEIIYRAELSKKVICCEIPSPSASSTSSTGSNDDTGAETTSDKLAFGVYAFPGLCDKVLAGPYQLHEDHQFSASIRTNDGSFEYAYIRTLEEKENFPQNEDSIPVKHINAKWWSGKKTADLTGQYLNFFFNPSVMKCALLPDKLCLTKIIEDHPCNNFHSYVTGRESNLVLFHDDINHIERTVVASSSSSSSLQTDNKSNQVANVTAPSIPPKSSRNLRKMPRRDYSRLVTDDMAIPARTKNLEFHIADVKSLRTHRYTRGERPPKPARSRYHESPQTHIMNERMRRLEFRNRRNDLLSILETRPSSCSNGNPHSLVSILNQAKEIIAYLEVDNNKLDDEGKRLRLEQSVMMRKFLALLRSLDMNSAAYKKGMAFVVSWKQMKAEHRNRLINILGQNFDKQRANKTTESPCNAQVNIKEPSSSAKRPVTFNPIRRLVSSKSIPKNQTTTEENERNIQHSKEDIGQRSKFRKQKRQKIRKNLKKLNNLFENGVTDSHDCEISAEVVCENGKLSDPLGSSHILDRMAEVPIIVQNVPSGIDLNAVDPLANDDSDDASCPPDGYSTAEKKEPSHPLYFEHSYCSNEDEPPNKSSNVLPMRLPQIKSVYSQNPGYRFIGPFGNSYRAPIFPTMGPSVIYRPPRPVFNKPTSSSQRRTIRTRMPAAAKSPSPPYTKRVTQLAGENLAIDLLDEGQMFARLNIAKINNGKKGKTAATSSCGPGAAGATTSNEIISIIDRFLFEMGKTTPEAKGNERIKQAKRKHIVTSLTKFISKLESRKQPVQDASYSSPRTSIPDNTSPPNVTDSIDLESGYSSKSEESSDRDYEPNTNQPILQNRPAEGQAIENIVLDDDEDEIESRDSVQVPEQEEEQEPVEIHIPEETERVVQADEFIVEQEEEEEIICEEEFIEEEEEEEIVDGSNTLEDLNDVDAAMRDDQIDRFDDSDDSTESVVSFLSDDCANIVPDLENNRLRGKEKRLTIPKPIPKMSYRTNQFTIIRSKNKFVPNIMKTPTKIVVNATSASDLSQIRVKPEVGLVKLSTASMQLTTNQACPTTSSDSNDSIIKRLWYSPVTRANPADSKVLQESTLDESVETNGLQSEKLVDEVDSNEEKGPSIEKDNSGANRILIKSFANHDRFKETFVTNVDKLLNPKL